MSRNIETTYIKDKFSILLSKLVVEAKLSYNEITDRLIEDDFLDSFERNDLSIFCDKSYEAITFDLFKKEVVYSQDIDPVIFWCGRQYMNLFLNRLIPLKQLFILCPLKQMEKYYEIYHEQSESKFIDVFMNKEYKNSILKKLRNKRNLSIRELSILTGISVNTLKYYENNINLYKASFDNINRILEVLEYSDSLVKKKTAFIPSFISLLEDKQLKQSFDKYIQTFYNTTDKIIFEYNSYWLDSKRKKLISSKVIDCAIIYSIEQYTGDRLLF